MPFCKLSLGPGSGSSRWQPRMARIVSGQDLSGLSGAAASSRAAWLTFCCQRERGCPAEEGAVASLGMDAPADPADEKLVKQVGSAAQSYTYLLVCVAFNFFACRVLCL